MKNSQSLQQLKKEMDFIVRSLNTSAYDESERIDKIVLMPNQFAYEVDMNTLELIKFRGDVKRLFGLDSQTFKMDQLFNSQHSSTSKQFYQDIADAVSVILSQPKDTPVSRNALGHLNTVKTIGGKYHTYYRTAWISGYDENKSVTKNMGVYTLLYEGVSQNTCAHVVGPEAHLYRAEHLTPFAAVFSRRELEILNLIAEGFSSKKIAESLFISPLTVDTHRKNMIKKLDVQNIPHLVARAKDLRLI
ncbi:MAG: helix-turn-helix transcriptional regulator [Bacteroidota bacterium]